MLDAGKLKELQSRQILSEDDYLDEKKRLAKKILRRSDAPAAKSGVIYILLAWFLGTIGVHNFYAGYFWRGGIQLILTLTSWFFMFIPLLFVAIWAFLELMLVNKSADGITFKGRRSFIWGLRIAALLWLASALYYSDIVFYHQETEINEVE